MGETDVWGKRRENERRATKTANSKKGQNNSSKISRVSFFGATSLFRGGSRISTFARQHKETTERARERFIHILYTIYLSRRERQRIKRDDDDDDDASSSSSRPRGRSLFLVVGEESKNSSNDDYSPSDDERVVLGEEEKRRFFLGRSSRTTRQEQQIIVLVRVELGDF